MIELNRHIISTLKWQSSFDKKEGAHAVQDRLSYWSKYSMPKETDAILDHISSPYITWQIDKLTIDLGVILLDELEHDLSARLKKELNEKLTDLLVSGNQSNKNVKVVHKNISINNLLEYYFLKGSMPWNFNQSYGSINDVLEYQIAHHSRDLIYLLRNLGKESNVRKRIAWQVNEKNQNDLIQKLEPYYYSFIFDTVDEMIEMQTKLKIVSTHISVFKKYLNLWVFDYLFFRANFVFRKERFIKHILSQMAQWSGMEVNLLNASIQDHAQGLKLQHISIFKNVEVIADTNPTQNKSQESNSPLRDELEESWIQLKKYLQNSPVQNPEPNYPEYNELVTRLYFNNASRFISLISTLDKATIFWSRAIKGLSKQSIEVFVKALAPTKSRSIIDIITLFERASQEFLKNSNPKDIWVVTITYLVNAKAKPINIRNFLKYIVAETSKSKSFIHIIDLFRNGSIPSSLKSIANIDTFSKVSKLSNRETSNYKIEKLKRSNAEIKHKIKTKEINTIDVNTMILRMDSGALIKTLVDHLLSRSIDFKSFNRAQKVFVLQIAADPISIFNSLLEYSDIGTLQKIIPLILDDYHAQLLLKKCRPEIYELLIVMTSSCNELNGKDVRNIIKPMKDQLMIMGLQIVLSKRNLSIEFFIECFFNKMYKLVNLTSHQVLNQIEKTIIENQNLESSGLSDLCIEVLHINAQKREFPSIEEEINEDQLIISEQFDYTKSRIFKGANGKEINEAQLYALIEKAIRIDSNEKIEESLEVALDGLIFDGLSFSPARFRKIIEDSDLSKISIGRLSKSIRFDQFISLAISDLHNGFSESLTAYKTLYQLVFHLGNEALVSESLPEFWKQALESIKTKNIEAHSLTLLVRKNLDLLSERESIDVGKIISEVSRLSLPFPRLLRDIFISENNAFLIISESETSHAFSTELKEYQEDGRIEKLLHLLILNNRIPEWYKSKEVNSPESLILEIVHFSPLALYNVLKRFSIPEPRLSSFRTIIPLPDIITIIQSIHPLQQKQLAILENFHRVLDQVKVKGINSKELKDVLYKKVVSAWTSGQWEIITPVNIWKEFMWDVCVQKNVDKVDFMAGMDADVDRFPPTIKMGFQLLKSSNIDSSKLSMNKEAEDFNTPLIYNKKLEMLEEGILVKNAGIVLLSSYIPMMFDRLSLTKESKFVDRQSQLDAVHFVQFLVTGLSRTEETLLPLNKLLCGIQPTQPIFDSINITEDQQDLMDGLINAAIGHWPAIGESSIMGFRGNWLVRDGLLSEQEDRWELRVDKRPYDLLINKSPFSFSIIKFPWMEKPIHVTWPY